MIRPVLAALLLGLPACQAVIERAPRPVPHADGPAIVQDRDGAARPADCGVHHATGDTVVYARGHYGVPILGKSFFWNGEGEVDGYGIGLYAHHYFWDDFAIGAGLNTSVYNTSGSDIYTGEFEFSGRWYVTRIDAVEVFVDANGGYQQATTGVPPGGTEWNFTFGFGPGLDVPLGDHSSLLVALNYHHMSNALGRQNPHNPSQNEGRAWIAYAWDW